MEEIVRPFQKPDRSQGFRPQSQLERNTARPLVAIGALPDGQTDFSPFARVDEPEDYGWWPRLRVLLAGGAEVCSVWKDVSGAFEIDPNVCLIWRLKCQSTALSLTFKALETPSWINRLLIWRNVNRVATVQVVIDWQAAASGTRTLTLGGVAFEAGETPEWTATVGKDVLQVQITSDGEYYGYPTALDVSVP